MYGRKALEELRIPQPPTICYGDNQAALTICNRQHASRKERHMRVRADHIKGVVEDQLVALCDIESSKNPSDIGTKAITAIDVWRYHACILHGKIPLGLPRSDLSSTDLRHLIESKDFFTLPKRSSKTSSALVSQDKHPSKDVSTARH
jgi:hypothetical protein